MLPTCPAFWQAIAWAFVSVTPVTVASSAGVPVGGTNGPAIETGAVGSGTSTPSQIGGSSGSMVQRLASGTVGVASWAVVGDIAPAKSPSASKAGAARRSGDRDLVGEGMGCLAVGTDRDRR